MTIPVKEGDSGASAVLQWVKLSPALLADRMDAGLSPDCSTCYPAPVQGIMVWESTARQDQVLSSGRSFLGHCRHLGSAPVDEISPSLSLPL